MKVICNQSPVIFNPLGDIVKLALDKDGLIQYQEVYASFVHSGIIKGWKKHLRMDLSLVVLVGEIKFVIAEENANSSSGYAFQEYILSKDQNNSIFIPHGLWVAFQGKDPNLNMLLNFANLTHDPLEVKSASIDSIPYKW